MSNGEARRTLHTSSNQAAETTENDTRCTFTPVAGRIFSSTLIETQFQSSPRGLRFADFRESAIYGSQLESFRSFTRSQSLSRDRYGDKENDPLFLGHGIFAGDCGRRQKTPSADDIRDKNAGGCLLEFSPGTAASDAKMEKKLKALRGREELRKANATKVCSSQGHIDLHATEEEFLGSVSMEPMVSSRQNVAAVSEASLDLPSGTSSFAGSGKATDATYVVPAKAQQTLDLESDGKEIRIFSKQATVSGNRKSVHLAALTSWLNYLLDDSNDGEEGMQTMPKNREDADKYLRKLLIAESKITPNVENNGRESMGYKFFLATRNLNEMRNRFRALYVGSPVPADISRVVKDGKIAIRADKRIYADVGLQAELLKLLLSFHPFYLRLGLETVLSFNIGVGTGNKNYCKIFAAVVAQNLFNDPKILQDPKYVHGRTKTLITERGAKLLLQHFLTKMCQFLYIVCEARSDDEISQKNQCMFVKSSTYKSISEVVAMLSRELMTGSSNLPKTLARLGVNLEFKQGFFEEFQYHVSNLSKDLSDGLVLGRAVEILAHLPYNAVINSLRNPSGDRLRKIRNVRVVINSAKTYGILPNEVAVNAEGIVHGNSDEILELLWRFVGVHIGGRNAPLIMDANDFELEIVSLQRQLQSQFGLSYEIRSPLELADGKLFSLLWKRYFPYGTSFGVFDGATVLDRIVKAAEFHFGIPPGLVVYSNGCYDGKSLFLFANIFFSRLSEYSSITCAAVKIQRAYRRYCSRKMIAHNETDVSCQAEDPAKRHQAATIIQCHVRGWLARIACEKRKKVQLLEQEKAATTIQCHARGWLARIAYRKRIQQSAQEKAATTIQCRARGWLARIAYRKRIQQSAQEKAATIIQCHARGWLARIAYRKRIQLSAQEKAAAIIQRYVRRWLARLQFRRVQSEESFKERSSAAITLQRYIRGWLARLRFRGLLHIKALKENADAVTLQSNSKGIKRKDYAEYMRKLRELEKIHNVMLRSYDKFIRASNKLFKAWWRGYLCRKKRLDVHQKLAVNRAARQEMILDEERAERMRPIMDRVMDAMKDLSSQSLYTRFKATEVLRKFVGLSEVCAQYVFENAGLERILDSLDGCNRGVGSTEVVMPLCSIMWSVLQFESIRSQLIESRRQVIVQRCFHFMLAFWRSPNILVDLSSIILALERNCTPYEKAPYFIAQLTKRVGVLPNGGDKLKVLLVLQKLQRHFPQ